MLKSVLKRDAFHLGLHPVIAWGVHARRGMSSGQQTRYLMLLLCSQHDAVKSGWIIITGSPDTHPVYNTYFKA